MWRLLCADSHASEALSTSVPVSDLSEASQNGHFNFHQLCIFTNFKISKVLCRILVGVKKAGFQDRNKQSQQILKKERITMNNANEK